jgi:hypothetical protein
VFTKPLADLYVEHDNGLDVGSDIKYLWMCAAKYGWIAHPKIGAFVTVHPGSFSVDKDVVTWEHDVIQNMRYVELIKNPDISEEVRVYSRRLLVESLRKTKVGFYFWATLRKILHAIYKNRPAEHCAADIRSFALSKRLVLARLLGIINNVGVIRKIVGASIRIFISVRRSLRKDVSVDTRNPDYADILEELKLHVE